MSKGRNRATLLGGLAILASIAVAAVTFFWIGAGASFERGATIHLTGDANLRTCASTSCPSVAVLDSGTTAIYVDSRTGETVRGSSQWVEVISLEGPGFVHSYFLASKGAARSSLLEVAISLIAATLGAALLGLSRAKTVIDRVSRNESDGILFGAVVGMGVLGLLAAFVIGSIKQVAFATFLGDTFLNLGSGFIGAGVTFVLFQVLLAGRGVSQEDFHSLQHEITKLRGALTEVYPARGPNVRGSRHRVGRRRANRQS